MRFRHELLRQLRLDLGMTQEELAEAAGINVRTYRRYESGQVNQPSFSVRNSSRRQLLAKLGRELGIAESELVEDISSGADGAIDPSAAAATASGARASSSSSTPPSWPPRFVHTLQPARHFVGRSQVLERLRSWSRSDEDGANIVALVAIGGAGKSAIAERFVEEVSAEPRRGGLLVWSFFENPRIEELIDRALEYFAPDDEEASSRTPLEQLEKALAAGPAHLMVLDGLESVQSPGTPARALGELEDPLLRRLLCALARGLGRSRALVTSRFELSDVAAWEGRGLATIALPGLTDDDAAELLERWGVAGNPSALAQLIAGAGGHALSLAMVGSYVGVVLGGDPAASDAIAELPLSQVARDDALARRLVAVLDAYAEALEPRQRDLLARLSAFAEGMSAQALDRLAQADSDIAGRVAGASTVELRRDLARLTRLGLVFSPGQGRYSTHPFVRQYFQDTLGSHDAARMALAIAGQPLQAPDHQAALEAYEAIALHMLHMDRADEAYEIYARSMGGFGHLGLALGEMSRGARIVRRFAQAGDPERMAPALAASSRSRLVYDWGLYSTALGDVAFAERCFRAFIELCRDTQAAGGQITGYRTLAYVERLAGELESARDHALESVALAEAQAHPGAGHGALVRGVALLGVIYNDLGAISEARACFARQVGLGDRPIARRSLWRAEHLLETGELARARAETAENAAACERLGWAGHVAHCHAVLGRVALREGDTAGARQHLARARKWAEPSGEVEMVLRCGELAAAIALRDPSEGPAGAERQALAGLHLARVSGALWFAPRFACIAAEALMERGEHPGALARLEAPLASGFLWVRARALQLASRAAAALGYDELGRAHRQAAEALLEDMGAAASMNRG